MRFGSKGIDCGIAPKTRIGHHLGVHPVAMRVRFAGDESEDHGLAAMIPLQSRSARP